MTRLCNSLAEVHAAYVELFRIKRHLANNGHRFCGLFAVEPEFLDIPTDKTTELVTSSGKRRRLVTFLPFRRSFDNVRQL